MNTELKTEWPKRKFPSLSTSVVLVVFILAASFPLLDVSGYTMSLVLLAMSYSIVVIGLNILLGYTGQLSLAQGAFFGLGAYTFAILTVRMGWPFWPSLIAGMITPVIFGLIIGLTTSRLSGHYLAMVTISFQIIATLVFNNWISVTHGPDGISKIPRPSLFGLIDFRQDTNYFYFCLVVVAIVAWFAYRLKHSRLGRNLEAIRENEMAAAVTGVRTYRIKVMAFILSAALAGLGGVVYAAGANYISPSNFGFEQSVVFLTMSMVGGTNSVFGGLVGSVLLVFLPEWLRFLKNIYVAVYGLMVILCVLFMPQGLWGLTMPLKRFFERQTKIAPAAIDELLPKTEMKENVLTVEGLAKHFGGLRAVDSVDFQVRAGEIKALIGPNGSGKTTMLNLCSGLYEPTSGKISFLGKDISGQRPENITANGISRTFQNIRLFSNLTVLENVMVGQSCRTKQGLFSVLVPNFRAKEEENRIRAKAYSALEFVGLLDKANQVAKNLSYGQQRLVEIARALATEPKLLFLDEPAAGLNPSETDELVTLLRKLNGFGLTMLLVEHDMSLVKKLATSAIVLNFGQKIAEGETENVLNEPKVVQAYLGKEEDNA
ncbi:branched-chain amino acid ABC transporter ATP-binding protein/permease [Paradesulfitobacterium aromaticivorans]